MKFLAVFVIACIALAAAQGPTKISSNNVGDIVTVDVNANANISNSIDATIVSVLLQYLNSQRIQVGGGNDGPNLPGLPNPPNLPPNWPNLPGPGPNWPNIPNLPGPGPNWPNIPNLPGPGPNWPPQWPAPPVPGN